MENVGHQLEERERVRQQEARRALAEAESAAAEEAKLQTHEAKLKLGILQKEADAEFGDFEDDDARDGYMSRLDTGLAAIQEGLTSPEARAAFDRDLPYLRRSYELDANAKARAREQERQVSRWVDIATQMIGESSLDSLLEDREYLGIAIGDSAMPQDAKDALLNDLPKQTKERLISIIAQDRTYSRNVINFLRENQGIIDANDSNEVIAHAQKVLRAGLDSQLLGGLNDPRIPADVVAQRLTDLQNNRETMAEVYNPREIDEVEQKLVDTLAAAEERDRLLNEGRGIVAGTVTSEGPTNREQFAAYNMAVEQDIMPILRSAEVTPQEKAALVLEQIDRGRAVSDPINAWVHSLKDSPNVADHVTRAMILVMTHNRHEAALQTAATRQNAGLGMPQDLIESQRLSSAVKSAFLDKDDLAVTSVIARQVQQGVDWETAVRTAYAMHEKRDENAARNAAAWDNGDFKSEAAGELQSALGSIWRNDPKLPQPAIDEIAEAGKFWYVQNGGDKKAAWDNARLHIANVWGYSPYSGRFERNAPEMNYAPAGRDPREIYDALLINVRDEIYDGVMSGAYDRTNDERIQEIMKERKSTSARTDGIARMYDNLKYVAALRPAEPPADGEELLKSQYDGTGWEIVYQVFEEKDGGGTRPVFIGDKPLVLRVTRNDLRSQREAALERGGLADVDKFEAVVTDSPPRLRWYDAPIDTTQLASSMKATARRRQLMETMEEEERNKSRGLYKAPPALDPSGWLMMKQRGRPVDKQGRPLEQENEGLGD